jgi:flagellin
MSAGDMDQAMERLASGKRINSAGDDAAGLAIANRLTSQVRGLDQAVRNANDGISLIQTAEGALQETTSILQRMRELSIQSANGTFTDGNRETLDAEVQQLKAELDRIAETTTFNGLNLLDGTLGNIDLQVGSEANQTIGFSVASTRANELGTGTGGDIVGAEMVFADLVTVNGNSASNGSIEINGQDIGSLTAFTIADGNQTTGSLGDVLDQINENVANVEASAFVEIAGSTDGTGILRGADELTLAMVKQDGTSVTYTITDTGSLQELADAITAETGGLINGSVDADGRLQIDSDSAAQITVGGTGQLAATGMAGAATTARMALTSTDGTDVTIDFSGSAAADYGNMSDGLGMAEREVAGDIQQTDTTAAFTQLDEGDLTINGVTIGAFTGATLAAAVEAINALSDQTGVVAIAQASDIGGSALTLNSASGEEITIAFGDGIDKTDLGGIDEANNSAASGKTIDNIDISTVAGAQSAIEVIDGALDTINSTRADLGAINNRLDFTINNLSTISQAASASRSRIEDADFAAESAALSRAQVLQQAGTAMLAQANAQPQQVLSLLQ